MSPNAVFRPQPPQPDLAAVKTRQQGAWSSGDYAIVGTTLQIVGESLCEALDLRAGSKVLDVAAGNGNATLAAARRWCEGAGGPATSNRIHKTHGPLRSTECARPMPTRTWSI